MDIEHVNTAAGAFIAGLVTSVHCVGMCGPLACGIAGMRRPEGPDYAAITGYHAGRMISYTLLGAIAGAITEVPVRMLVKSPAVLLPWFLVLVLACIGLGLDHYMPRVPGFQKLAVRARLHVARLGSRKGGGLALGLATPLLPCTPLYLILGAALASGSPSKGAEFMGAFALGTIPLLCVTQTGWFWFHARFGATAWQVVRRSLALVTALLMAWRLRGTLPWVEVSGPGCCGG